MSSMIVKAARFAQQQHEGQTRKGGEPYINHPMRVAGIVTMCEHTTEDMIAAAWLHDVVEDTEVTDVELRRLFNENIANLVYHLTDVYTKENYPELNRAKRKQREHERLGNTNMFCAPVYGVHTIKLADRIDNTTDVFARGRKWAEKYIGESFQLIAYLNYGDTELRDFLIRRLVDIDKEMKND